MLREGCSSADLHMRQATKILHFDTRAEPSDPLIMIGKQMETGDFLRACKPPHKMHVDINSQNYERS